MSADKAPLTIRFWAWHVRPRGLLLLLSGATLLAARSSTPINAAAAFRAGYLWAENGAPHYEQCPPARALALCSQQFYSEAAATVDKSLWDEGCAAGISHTLYGAT